MKNNKYKQMNFNENDIEYYLLTKEYASLSSKEMEFVKEAIPTEEEYNSMRQLLLAMEEVPLEDELTPNPVIKDSLVTVFEKARWEKGIETKEAAQFVAIHQEKDKRKKGVFWFSIAASIVLLIGLFLNREYLFLPENNQLAMLDEPKNVEEKNKEIAPKKESVVEIDMDNETESSVSIEEKELLEYDEVAAKAEDDSDSQVVDLEEDLPQNASLIEQPLAGNIITNQPVQREVILDGILEDSDEFALNEEVLEEPSYVGLSDKEVTNTDESASAEGSAIITTKSQTLEGDKEMIDLFYTAL